MKEIHPFMNSVALINGLTERIKQLEADYSSEVQAKELAIESLDSLKKKLDSVKELSELRFKALCKEQEKVWDLKQELKDLKNGNL
jgi:transcriptional regulator NrdR family protein